MFLERLSGYSQIPLRLALSVLFIFTGITKLDINQTAGLLEKLSFPMPKFFAVVLLIAELLGGLCLLVGFMARWASSWLFIIPFIGLFVFNLPQISSASGEAQFFAMIDLFKNIAILGGLTALALGGTGPWSMDNLKNGK